MRAKFLTSGLTILAVLFMFSSASMAGYRVRAGHRHARHGVAKFQLRSIGGCPGGRCPGR